VKIRATHGDLKGSFTCLGVWFNLFNKESMDKLEDMLTWDSVTPGDRKTAKQEIAQAKRDAENWTRKSGLDFLYDAANEQGDWTVKF
jgi:hypothetical protein